jgi:DNA polymerase-3 subunit epsilon
MTQKIMDSFDLNSAIESIKSLGFKVIRPLTSRTCYTDTPPPEKLLKAAILDIETTGLNPEADKIIELGIVIVEFCKDTGQIYGVLNTYNELEDPGILIPPETTKINGITDDMVHGKKLIDANIECLMTDVALIIAHNAAFDRGFVESRFSFFQEKAWACSLAQIPWKNEGFSHSSLEFISYKFGFHFSAHRALDDCLALLEVLQSELPESRVKVFKVLLESARTTDFKLWALNTPYETKDKLKKRGYKWDGANWHITVTKEDLEHEIDWFRVEIYGNNTFQLKQEQMTAYNRFSVKNSKAVIVSY